jgi:hypothetical protein
MLAASHATGMILQPWLITGKRSIADRQLLEDAVKHKSAFFRASCANYEACFSGGLRLIPGKPLLGTLGPD